jgi:hypothetical protein
MPHFNDIGVILHIGSSKLCALLAPLSNETQHKCLTLVWNISTIILIAHEWIIVMSHVYKGETKHLSFSVQHFMQYFTVSLTRFMTYEHIQKAICLHQIFKRFYFTMWTYSILLDLISFFNTTLATVKSWSMSKDVWQEEQKSWCTWNNALSQPADWCGCKVDPETWDRTAPTTAWSINVCKWHLSATDRRIMCFNDHFYRRLRIRET